MNYIKSKKEKIVDERRKTASYSSLGMMFPASIAVGLAIGYFLDKWLGTAPYLVIFGTLYGVGAGFYNLVKITRPTKKDQNNSHEPRP